MMPVTYFIEMHQFYNCLLYAIFANKYCNMPRKLIHIIKASGEVVPFSIEKLKESMRRTGAGEEIINDVVREVEANLHEGMATREIYKYAFRLLSKRQKPLAAKYSLKRAIMELGPSGFPFEKYMSLILRRMGYMVRINQFLQGACVNHEVDIIAENENSACFIECKYHNLPGVICDVKVPLYVNSRFQDIIAAEKRKDKEYECWIITNTKFSSDAVKYGTCAGIRLLGWDYPAKGNIKQLIDNNKLYPVSCLTTVTKKEKQLLMEKGIILCEELVANAHILTEHRIVGARMENIINEAMSLSN
jgi:hypothetical protein